MYPIRRHAHKTTIEAHLLKKSLFASTEDVIWSLD